MYYCRRKQTEWLVGHVGTEPPLPGYYQYFWRVNAPCSRTQHGLTRVGLKSPNSGSGVRGINHQATALPANRMGVYNVIPYVHKGLDFNEISEESIVEIMLLNEAIISIEGTQYISSATIATQMKSISTTVHWRLIWTVFILRVHKGASIDM